METADWIALTAAVFAGFAALGALLLWWENRRLSAHTATVARANESMAASNRELVAIGRDAAAAAERSAESVRRSTDILAQDLRLRMTARFRLTRGSTFLTEGVVSSAFVQIQNIGRVTARDVTANSSVPEGCGITAARGFWHELKPEEGRAVEFKLARGWHRLQTRVEIPVAIEFADDEGNKTETHQIALAPGPTADKVLMTTWLFPNDRLLEEPDSAFPEVL